MSSARTLATVFALAALAAVSSVDAAAQATGPRCPGPPTGPALQAGADLHLRIDANFSAYERARLLRAVNEWNLALDGAARFDIVEASPADRAPPGAEPVWQVFVNRSLSQEPAPRGGYPLAMTLPSGAGGGLVLVNTAEIDGRDITTVMRHELGHVLGLCHDPSGGLMTAQYSPHDQGCIDQGTMAALADELAVPALRLQGCARR